MKIDSAMRMNLNLGTQVKRPFKVESSVNSQVGSAYAHMHARCFKRVATGPFLKTRNSIADDSEIAAIIENITRASVTVDPSAVDHSTTPPVHTRKNMT